jgi:uncharacterized membrane protein YeaQ/YmgE (transglycosylase-associated protein family)
MRFCRLFRFEARWAPLLRVFIVVTVLTAPSVAAAQTAPSQDAAGSSPQATMTLQEKQGFGCLYAGILGVVGAYVYADIIAIAVSGMLNPSLLVPVLASGFAVACGVGSQATPALLRMFSRS